MKPYLLFSWDARYGAKGGFNDLTGSYDSLELAKLAIPPKLVGHVVRDGEIIAVAEIDFWNASMIRWYETERV